LIFKPKSIDEVYVQAQCLEMDNKKGQPRQVRRPLPLFLSARIQATIMTTVTGHIPDKQWMLHLELNPRYCNKDRPEKKKMLGMKLWN